MSNFNFKLLILFSLFSVGCSSTKKSSSSSSASVIIVDDGATNIETGPKTISSPTAPAARDAIFYSSLQKKYAAYLKLEPQEITNVRLYSFIDNWMGTPYLWGGTTKNGIDCSAFVQKLIDYVYDVNIPRTSIDQFYTNWIELFGSTKYLSEGDMIFFRTIPGTTVSHIGFYLKNNMFVNSSSSKGVSIANLNDPYWKKKYVAAGRIKSSMLINYKKTPR